MASFINPRCNKASSASPRSSIDSVEPLNATPASAITAFSPEVARYANPNPPVSEIGSTPVGESLNDPFIATVTKKKTGVKLSATASEFQPHRLLNGYGNPAQPGTIQFLQRQIDAAAEVTKMGSFTKDTIVSRCFMVTSTPGYDVVSLVNASLNKLAESGWGPKGSLRKALTDGIIYMRFSDIRDSELIFNSIRSDNIKGLVVKYMSCAAWAAAAAPGMAPPSDYEGQVYLEARYPHLDKSHRKEFEEHLRDSLAGAGGPLRAWQKISTNDQSVLKMIIEFADAAKARNGVEKCNGGLFNGESKIELLVAHCNQQVLAKAKENAQLTPIQAQNPNVGFDTMRTMNNGGGSMQLNNRGQESLDTSRMFASSNTPGGLAYTPTNGQFGMQGPPALPFVRDNRSLLAVGERMFEFGGPSIAQAINSTPTHGYQVPGMRNNEFSPTGLQQRVPPPGLGYSTVTPASSNPNHSSGLRRNAVKLQRPHSPSPSSQCNRVELRRIEEGIDVKTTIMLRNIPNKIDQATLKSIVDESSFGRYDFMYLRIDFSNNCNVGYAFINFVRAIDIISFVSARANKKWNRFNSDKIAEVSYATIQGRESLIHKFRNSSVMLEPPHHRPKLFYTISDAFGRAGQEEPFALPDNQAKLRRSCDNAEHVGLYAPSSGQHLRDEQRRRRSQYDRGTSLAAQEEHDYEAMEGRGRGRGWGRGSNYRSY